MGHGAGRFAFSTLLGFYEGVADGVYDSDTADAVRRFLAAHGLSPDGIVGPDTYDALMKELDMERGATDS